MNSKEKGETDSSSVSHSLICIDVTKESHNTRMTNTGMRTKTFNGNQADDFDHSRMTSSNTDVYDELVAYGRQEDNSYLKYVERVERYVARTSVTKSSDLSSKTHTGGHDEAQKKIANPNQSSTGGSEWDHRNGHEGEAPYRRSFTMSLRHTCSSSRAWRSTEASVDGKVETPIEEDVYHVDDTTTHNPISTSEGPPLPKEGVHDDRTVSQSLAENVGLNTRASHVVSKQFGKASPMNDFDAELLEIIKAYYECRQISFSGVVHKEYQHQGAEFSEGDLLTSMPVRRGILQGNAIPLSAPTHSLVPRKDTNARPQDLSFTRSTPSHSTTQFLETRPLDSTFLNTQSDLLPSNDPKVAPMGVGMSLFHRTLAVYNNQAKPLITVPPRNPTGYAPGHRRGLEHFSRDDSTEKAFLTSFPSSSPTSFVRAYVLDMNINLEPAIAVTGLAAILNIIVVYFLQNHVLDTLDHLGLFLVGSYLTFSSYYMIYYFLERDSSSFRRIASTAKKFYIIGNLIKAGILISITPFAVYHLTRIVLYDEWEGNTLRNLGCIFALPDFVAMIVVERMRWSTWIHHLCVVIFNYFSIMNDYKKENIFRCIVVYAGFSSFGYCVNVLLASRFFGLSPSLARILSFVALVVYGLCCSVNWSWQVYYVLRLIRKGRDLWSVYLYLMLICFVVWDDIVLNRWLLNHAKNMAYAASKQQHP